MIGKNIKSLIKTKSGRYPAILGKGPWPKFGKNDRLNVNIGKNE